MARAASPRRDPLAPVLELGVDAVRVGALLAVAGSLLLHGGFAARAFVAMVEVSAFAEDTRFELVELLRAEYEVEVEEETPVEPPAPEPEPEVPEPVADEPPEPLPTDRPLEPTDEPASDEEPAPATAEMGQALTAEPDPEAPVDMTDFTIGVGSGEYRGGVSSGAGTSKTAVRDRRAKPRGKPGGRGTATTSGRGRAKPAVSKARAPAPVQAAWNCGFPPEAETEQIEQALVKISVVVGPAGTPQSVHVHNDPGYGFGRLARSCAMRKTYRPALDDWGKPTMGTAHFGVRFRLRR